MAHLAQMHFLCIFSWRQVLFLKNRHIYMAVLALSTSIHINTFNFKCISFSFNMGLI